MAIAASRFVMEKLVEALGLKGQPLRRIVIDCPYDDVVTVYIQRLLQDEETDKVAEAVTVDECQVLETTAIHIDDRGNVLTPEWRTYIPSKREG